jgi:glycosyltransferase involved in cell wall biosynthesis
MKMIWPEVLEKFPESKMIIAGNISDFVENQPPIVKLGIIKDIKDAYDMADVAISPVFAGTGLKIKNIEALGYGMPLLTTPYGAVGLENGSYKPFLICRNDKDFVKNIEKLFTNANFAETLSENAVKFAQNYNLKNLAALKKVIETIPGDRGNL